MIKPARFLTFLLACLPAAGTLPPLVAGAGPGTRRISVEAGGDVPAPAGSFSDQAGPGFYGGIQYLWNMDDYTSVGGQLEYFHIGGREHLTSSAPGGRLNATSQADVGDLELVARYTILPVARFKPYVDAGLGANTFHQTSEGAPAPGSAWVDTNTTETRRLPNVSSLGVSFSAGAGVETNLTERVVLGLEAAWHLLGVSPSAYGHAMINIPSISVRVGWRFGQEPLPPGA